MLRYDFNFSFALLLASGIAVIGVLLQQPLLFIPSQFMILLIITDLVIRFSRWVDKKLQEPSKHKPWGIK